MNKSIKTAVLLLEGPIEWAFFVLVQISGVGLSIGFVLEFSATIVDNFFSGAYTVAVTTFVFCVWLNIRRYLRTGEITYGLFGNPVHGPFTGPFG